MLPKFITFTGVDDRTDIEKMVMLSKQFPIEWGILVSPTNRDARFPSTQMIYELVDRGLKLSLHCCGGFSKAVQKGDSTNLPVPVPANRHFERMQLNGRIYNPDALGTLSKLLGVEIIIQQRNHFRPKPVLQLFDASGGKGLLPDYIPPHPGYMVGYAGGIGSDTCEAYLKKINAPEGAEYWIDMESKVRTDGWFDLNKVWLVCCMVYGTGG